MALEGNDCELPKAWAPVAAGDPGAVMRLVRGAAGQWEIKDLAEVVGKAVGLAGFGDPAAEPGTQGHPIQVAEDGSTVLVVDQQTGVVSRIDPAQLSVPHRYDYGAPGPRLVTGGGGDPAGGRNPGHGRADQSRRPATADRAWRARPTP